MSLSEKGVNACDRKSSQTQTSTHPKQTKHLENQSHPLLPKGKETFKILVGCGRECFVTRIGERRKTRATENNIMSFSWLLLLLLTYRTPEKSTDMETYSTIAAAQLNNRPNKKAMSTVHLYWGGFELTFLTEKFIKRLGGPSVRPCGWTNSLRARQLLLLSWIVVGSDLSGRSSCDCEWKQWRYDTFPQTTKYCLTKTRKLLCPQSFDFYLSQTKDKPPPNKFFIRSSYILAKQSKTDISASSRLFRCFRCSDGRIDTRTWIKTG